MKPSDSERGEPNRVLGFPIRGGGSGPAGTGRSGRDGEEPQRALGIPVDWFGPADFSRLRWLSHPVQEYRRWAEHR